VAISPGGDIRQRRLLTGDANGHAKVWTGTLLRKRWSVSAELIGHLPGYAITAARFLPDGRQLLTACEDHTVMRWNAETGQRLAAGTLKHPGAVRDMDLTSDGRHAVTVCSSSQRSGEITREGFLLVHWELEPVRELRRLLVTDEAVTSAGFDQEARGVLVASMTPGGASAVKRWDLVDGQYRPLWSDDRGRGSVWAAFPSPDGAQVLTVGGSYARLWDAHDRPIASDVQSPRTARLRQLFAVRHIGCDRRCGRRGKDLERRRSRPKIGAAYGIEDPPRSSEGRQVVPGEFRGLRTCRRRSVMRGC
jgi:hypothetical protein